MSDFGQFAIAAAACWGLSHWQQLKQYFGAILARYHSRR